MLFVLRYFECVINVGGIRIGSLKVSFIWGCVEMFFFGNCLVCICRIFLGIIRKEFRLVKVKFLMYVVGKNLCSILFMLMCFVCIFSSYIGSRKMFL